MDKPTAPELNSTAPSAAHVATRRADFSTSTKRALIDVAEQLFAEQGYAATPLDQIVAGARVTKGALYHHFSGKQALFESVVERIETEARTAIQSGLEGTRDPWDNAQIGLQAFLDVVQRPAYRRIVAQDGPCVLGHERFREHEERSTFAMLVEIVRGVLTSGDFSPGEEMLNTFSRIVFGAVSSAGESVATSDDPAEAAARARATIGFVLAGLRSLADAGAPLPNPTGPGRDAAG